MTFAPVLIIQKLTRKLAFAWNKFRVQSPTFNSSSKPTNKVAPASSYSVLGDNESNLSSRYLISATSFNLRSVFHEMIHLACFTIYFAVTGETTSIRFAASCEFKKVCSKTLFHLHSESSSSKNVINGIHEVFLSAWATWCLLFYKSNVNSLEICVKLT